ncbi:hypothetical protein I302_107289 [Kwoniella bestiolae CBS 10118]|uniref:BCS1 N-terminal domain-containing protein n=1 Tax=Kwoniella bestiolae CBS 10118 TaxID=1296100 RepID=A0A1B9FYZ2_9TREE|nr:hypothetical protein I302_06975 [Kwoniella bestiolae CBS 10118]OCF23989.1 hypothetical protein I302_06975 [Kwoniella bestiolae CBS 10118]
MTQIIMTYLTTLLTIFTAFIQFIQDHPVVNEWLKYLSVGAVIEFCRGYLPLFVQWVSQSIVATVRISEEDESYDWIYNYLSTLKDQSHLQTQDPDQSEYSFLQTVIRSLPFSGRSTLMDVTVSTNRPRHYKYYMKAHHSMDEYMEAKFGHYGGEGKDKVRMDMVPSIGASQKIKYNGKTITISIKQDDDPFREGKKWIIMRAYFTTPRMFTSLLTESRTTFQTLTAHKTSIYTPTHRHGASWPRTSSKPNRPWESIFLDEHIKDWIMNDCKEFLKESEFYLNRGIPYRRGYLCFGVAGSGKSSMIGALAAKLNLDIYLINLGGKNLDDDSLQELLQECPAKCLLLMEDIDCAFTTKTPEDEYEASISESENPPVSATSIKSGKRVKSARQSKQGITLSGLLNALDGVASSEGRLLFCTTNWKERIDPALSRPGRCDIWIEFKHATRPQAKSLFEYFYRSNDDSETMENPNSKDEKSLNDVDEITSLAQRFASYIPEDTISVSALQGYLMRYKRQPKLAVENVGKWVENGCGQGPTPLLHDGRVDLKIMSKEVDGDVEAGYGLRKDKKVNGVMVQKVVNGVMEHAEGDGAMEVARGGL